MTIRHATNNDIDLLLFHDKHISKPELATSISLSRVLIAEHGVTSIGWLRYNLFWDNTPFMNMLYILEPYQRQGFGTALVAFWEEEMKRAGFSLVMTSTQQNEFAQHFYTRLGYRSVGGFTLPNEPLEIIFVKNI